MSPDRFDPVDPAWGTRRADADVIVHGSGIVGCAAALALAAIGLRVALVDARDRGAADAARPDVRAYAINPASQALLDRLGAWGRLPPTAVTPVYDMHVAGDARVAALDFSAWQQRVGQLAWIVDAAALEAALKDEVGARGLPVASSVDADASAPALMVIAEGKASATRDRLGVSFDVQGYGQRAVAARLVCDRPHRHTARQWFLAPDVLALLPFDRPEPGASFALVWSVSEERAQVLQSMPQADFERELAQATQGTVDTQGTPAAQGNDDGATDGVGGLRLASERASWPLSLGRADRIAGPGWVLVGDAAHQVHPLAGQGLNLGLGDVEALADVLHARETWRSVGDERLLGRYAVRRSWPVAAMTGMTDALQWLFAHPSPLARELRNRGMGLVDSLPPLKRWLTARALAH